MALPAPTVTSIDVPRERLAQADRDATRAARGIDIAGGARDAMGVALMTQEAFDKLDQRAQAQWFQKEYVDKGWEGYEKLWQEQGAPPAGDPRIVRQSIGDSPVAAFKYLGQLDAAKKQAEATKTFAGRYRDTDPALATAIEGGLVEPKTALEEEGRSSRSKAEITSREKIASAQNTLKSIELGLKKSEKADAKGVNAAARKALNAQMKSFEAELKRLTGPDGSRRMSIDEEKIFGSLLTRINNTQSKLNELTVKDPSVVDDVKPPPAPAPDAPRPRATNPKTGEVVEWDGTAWLPVKK